MKTKLLKRLRQEASNWISIISTYGFQPKNQEEFRKEYDGLILRRVAELKEERK